MTVGSSKGGSSALLFGLHHKVDIIIVGACQYNIGTYVARFPDVFHGMMGDNAGSKEVDFLDSLVGKALDESKKNNHIPEIHVLFSKRELTYERQIKDFINKLQELNWPSVLVEEEFEDHGDVGKYFSPYLRSLFVDI